jgi:hypothetical protein
MLQSVTAPPAFAAEGRSEVCREDDSLGNRRSLLPRSLFVVP